MNARRARAIRKATLARPAGKEHRRRYALEGHANGTRTIWTLGKRRLYRLSKKKHSRHGREATAVEYYRPLLALGLAGAGGAQ